MISRSAIAAVLLLAACVDGPTTPGRSGEVRFRPSYAAGDSPTALGVAVDSAAVRIVRPAEPAAPLVDSMVAYASDTASLGWIVDLRSDEESLRVAVTLWSGGTRLYDGDSTLLVRDGVTPAGTVEPVPVDYVGPAIVATVTVAPETVTLDAFGATTALSAEARDRHGVVVPATLTWTSGDGAVATVEASGVVTAAGNGTTTVRAAAGAVHDDATIVVAQRVAAITVTPGTATLTARGATQSLGAAARDANGHPVAGAAIAWTSSDLGVASVNSTGVVTAVAGGSATITATSGGVTGSALVTVNPIADVASIAIAPATATLTAVGATRQFTAEARDTGGNVLTGVQFSWSSSTSAVATIDAASGLAHAAGHGATTVTAAAGAVVGTATLTVDLSTSIASVSVLPATATLTTLGATQQYTAQALDAGGTVVPVASFAWSSDAPPVATVSGSGLATATGHGSAVISASVSGVSGSANVTVELTATVASVVVTPPTASLTALGGTQQFTAEAHDAAGHTVPGVPFAWTSSATNVATVNATGLGVATGHGSATIRAAVGVVQGQATLTVDLATAVARVTVAPETATLAAVGATRQFTALARDAGGTVLPGVPFLWSSSVPGVATVGASTGLATAVAHGTTTIAASAGGVSGSATLTVDLSTSIASVVVSPTTATLTSLGATQQFAATAHDVSGAVVPVASFAWSSNAPAVATVSGSGLATATGHGSAVVSATAGGVAGVAQLTVELEATVATVVVTPESATLTSLGATQQFTADARDAAGRLVPGVPFTWTSSAVAVATIDAAGLARATGQGTTSITAASGSAQGSAGLIVDLSATVATVVVTPATATLNVLGSAQSFVAEARDAGGAPIPGITFTWTSSAPTVATVDDAGVATAAGHGTTVIAAAAGGVAGTATLTVDLTVTVAQVVVTPREATLGALGATQLFTAVARDAGGNIVPGMTFVWNSTAPSVASVGPNGLATATGHGTTTITATAGGVQGNAGLIVDLSATVATVVVTPATATLHALGATQQYSAVARDAAGNVIPGVSFTWTIGDAAVATIDAGGLATATGNGTTTVRATSGGATGTATLEVHQTAVTIAVTPARATIEQHTTLQFVAVARDANGHVIVGAVFTWSSDDPWVAEINTNGLATALHRGIAAIRASADGVTGEATLIVERDPKEPPKP